MNMQGVFLHVLGDALGNVGVIASGLLIALLDTPYRFYSDPLISFIITVIIFSSALPLGASARRPSRLAPPRLAAPDQLTLANGVILHPRSQVGVVHPAPGRSRQHLARRAPVVAAGPARCRLGPRGAPPGLAQTVE